MNKGYNSTKGGEGGNSLGAKKVSITMLNTIDENGLNIYENSSIKRLTTLYNNPKIWDYTKIKISKSKKDKPNTKIRKLMCLKKM